MSSEQNSGQEHAAVPLEVATSGGLSVPETLNEDTALALLKQPDLSPEIIEKLSQSGVMKLRKIKLAVAGHPKTPRHISLPMVRHLFTLDCMHLALTPIVPADVKKAAEDALINRL